MIHALSKSLKEKINALSIYPTENYYMLDIRYISTLEYPNTMQARLVVTS